MNISKDVQMVGFRVGQEIFGVPISLVHEIVRVPHITAVPEARRGLEGVISLRGKVVPVLDLRKLFGAEDIQANKKNRILVAEIEGKLVGLMVDAASEVLRLAPDALEPAPDIFDGGAPYVTGVGKLKDRLIITVDLTKVIKAEELEPLFATQDA
jgi:purine-binding chemotaxis protein CheW